MRTTILILATLAVLLTQSAQGATELLNREVVMAGPTGTLTTNQVLEVSHEISTGIEKIQTAVSAITEGIITLMGVAAGIYAAFVRIKQAAKDKQILALVQGIHVSGSEEAKKAVEDQSEQLGVAPQIDKVVQAVKAKDKSTGFLTKSEADSKPPLPPAVPIDPKV